MKKYLIDTHVLIWMALEPSKLSATAKSSISNVGNFFFSYASVWEMAIKISTGKLEIGSDLPDFIDDAIDKYGLQLMPVQLKHIFYTQQLYWHHRDPFDRLLIAQSFSENIPVISSDEMFDLYNVNRVWK